MQGGAQARSAGPPRRATAAKVGTLRAMNGSGSLPPGSTQPTSPSRRPDGFACVGGVIPRRRDAARAASSGTPRLPFRRETRPGAGAKGMGARWQAGAAGAESFESATSELYQVDTEATPSMAEPRTDACSSTGCALRRHPCARQGTGRRECPASRRTSPLNDGARVSDTTTHDPLPRSSRRWERPRQRRTGRKPCRQTG